MHRDHLGDAIQVGFVNAFAVAFSVVSVEQILRIFSLILAIFYTTLKIRQALKGDDDE